MRIGGTEVFVPDSVRGHKETRGGISVWWLVLGAFILYALAN